MISILKKKEFWGSAILAIITFLLIGQITSWQNFFPFVHFFNAITVVIWAIVLYTTLIKGWNKIKYKNYAIILIVVAIPHTILSLLSYGSMVCLSISVIMVIILFVKAH